MNSRLDHWFHPIMTSENQGGDQDRTTIDSRLRRQVECFGDPVPKYTHTDPQSDLRYLAL